MPPRPPVRALLTPITAARYASSSSKPTAASGASLFTSNSTASSSRARPAPAPAQKINTAASSRSPEPISRAVPDAKAKTKSSGPQPIPPLPRPLGISLPPTSNPKSWSQRKSELLDEERHKAKRKVLVKEATQGYFHDYNRARGAGGGKIWIAPKVLIREDKALYFPDISGRSLLSENVHTTDLFRGRTTLVSLISTRISEEHVQSFVQATLDDLQGHPGFSYVQINHQRNPLKSMLLSLLQSSLKRTIPQERWGSYMISGGEWSEFDVNQPLGLENKLLGYVFLVDHDCKVRWAGCGAATDEEAQSLRRATAVLLGRMRGNASADAATDSSS